MSAAAGSTSEQKIVTGPGYQVDFAATIRREAGMPTMAVGRSPRRLQAETIVAVGAGRHGGAGAGHALGPALGWHAAAELGEDLSLPAPYARANPALRGKPFITPEMRRWT
jgi:2,4-dienoyl-CoA reductase-like NADH-dependent reductase (Old Yellow Enzyme family)